MKINLPTVGFAPFKVFFGAGIVGSFLLFKDTMVILAPLIALVVGKAHSLGAWVAMWKAGKLNYKYVTCIAFFIGLFTYLGIYVWSLEFLTFFTAVLFIFHFMFDEFDLQEEKREWSKLVAPLTFFLVAFIYMVQSFGYYQISFDTYLGLIILSVLLEHVFLKEITWHYVNMKILQLFLLFFIYNGIEAIYFITTILMWHYLFWFIYPVYKVHKYKREDRDGLILILVIIVLTSTFFSYAGDEVNMNAIKDITWRYFNIITIVHILGTAPFGYLFFLPKSKYGHK